MFMLSVVSPERVLYEQEVQGIVVPGSEGYLGVLSNHAPLISSLAPGKITITESDEKQRIAAVSGGFIEVSGNVATLLAETDLDRARTAYQRAKERLGLKKSAIDMQRAQAALRRAENRLKIAEGKSP